MFRAAATAHIETADGVAARQRRVRQAARVARGAGSLQSVNHDNFAFVLVLRALEVREHLDIGLGLKQQSFDGPPAFDFRTRPEVARNRCQVRIAEQRIEASQTLIVEREL